MDPPRPHWAHHNHSDQHINLIFTPFLWQPIIPSPPHSTNFDDNDNDNDNNNNNNNNNNHTRLGHPSTRQQRSPSPPPSPSHNDSGYFTLPPSSSPRRPNRKHQRLTVVNPTPSPPPHPPTLSSIIEQRLASETVNNNNAIETTNLSQQRPLSWPSDNDNETDDEDVTGRCASSSTTDLLGKSPVAGKKDAGAGIQSKRSRGEARLDRCLQTASRCAKKVFWKVATLGDGVKGEDGVGGMGLGSAGGYGREGLGHWMEVERGLEGRASEEGKGGNVWGRVKRAVGRKEGPVGVRRAKERFALD